MGILRRAGKGSLHYGGREDTPCDRNSSIIRLLTTSLSVAKRYFVSGAPPPSLMTGNGNQ